MTPTFQRLADELARTEAMIVYAEACIQIQETDAWKTIGRSVQREVESITDQLVNTDQLTEHEAGMLKGGIRMGRFLLSLPKMKSEKLAEYRRRAEHLREQVKNMRTRGLDKVPSDIREAVTQLRTQLQGAD